MKKLICAVTVLAVSATQAATIHVDIANCPGPGNGSVGDPYCSIQTAIDNAADTDQIVVVSGAYFEMIDFLGKAITVRSSDGPEVTIIDGTGFFHVVLCAGGEGRDTVLDGFTITGGNADEMPYPNNAGGGLATFDSSPTVTNCTFSENTATHGGGMFSDGGSPTVTNCTFIGNTAAVTGGGMSNFHSCPTVTDCIFTENSAGGGAGGGMYNDGEIPVVTNCTFSANSADVGGGMSNDLSDPMVTNCRFFGNSAGVGGGMINYGGSCPTVTNCTFSENTATSHGGGMSNLSDDPTVTNCILWGNSPNEFSGTGSPTVSYSTIQGGIPGTGNIDADPMFIDPDNGDFRLAAGSPCIDAGHNWAIAGITDIDLDGNPRFAADRNDFDPGCGIPVVVDMGAYEYQGDPFPVTLSDIDGDGIVGIIDFLALLADWGSCVEQCCLADLDLDGNVGILDMLVLLGAWT